MDNIQEVLVRDPNEFPEELKVALDIVTINESPRVVGSAAFLQHRYPSDVDVFEKVTVRLPREAALGFYADQFKNIMEKILVEPEIYYMDFKAGQDVRFDLVPPGTVIERREMTDHLYDQGLLTFEETVYFYQAADDPETFREALRGKRVLRWTPEEVIAGRKELPGGTFILLRDALAHPSVVKLDVVSWVLLRFQSIEVFYNLLYIDPIEGPVEFYPLGSYRESLLEDVQRYSSRMYYNPLKLAKRLWSLSRVAECSSLVAAINPLLSSHAAALNQINSDCELLINFVHRSIEQQKGGPLTKVDAKWSSKTVRRLFLEMLGFHKRITNHLTGEAYQTVHQIIDGFFDLWVEWQVSGRLDREGIVRRLEAIRRILRDEIYKQSHEFLRRLDEMGISCPISRSREITGLDLPSTYSPNRFPSF